MTRVFGNAADLVAAQGETIGTSDWFTVTQQHIDNFADATFDHQWLHVDPERAARGPFGTTIAHGYLTLSLLPYLTAQISRIDNVEMRINYGLNKVRFPWPVSVGSRVRARSAILSVDVHEQYLQVVTQVIIEIQGQEKPACIAETVARIVL
ncbi:MaoC family dehydratase [Nocardia speluncae]|uniref:MaoC family dehydratase n=1 Tax=Nocardia speluncae TaxID=419477 RepID=A0A846XCD8_9NOCA|nr:MaoC family dehydratase [Nocardia speluncae]NKY32809.1 MaoC family dehydratase [Nocardia speluncae]